MYDAKPSHPAGTAVSEGHEDECPSWCCGGCDDTTELHANEFEGVSDYSGDGGGLHAISRTIQDRHGGPVLVEHSVMDADGNEVVLRLTASQAAEVAAALDSNVRCAQAVA